MNRLCRTALAISLNFIIIPCSFGALSESKNLQRQTIIIPHHGSSDPLSDKLFQASIQGTAEQISKLFKEGANIDAPATFYRTSSLQLLPLLNNFQVVTPLRQAARFGNTEFLRTCKNHGKTFSDSSLLALACNYLHPSTVEFLICNGHDVQSQFVEDQNEIVLEDTTVPVRYESLLHRCVAGCIARERESSPIDDVFPACVKLLINAGLNINERDHLGRTALHKAARGAFYSLVPILIHEGADVRARDSSNNNPLHTLLCLNSFRSYDFPKEQKDTAEALILAGTPVSTLYNKEGASTSFYPNQKESLLILFKDKGISFIRLMLKNGHLYNQKIERQTFFLSKEYLIQIAPISYAMFIPSEEELILSRKRIAEFLFGVRLNYNLTSPYLLGMILAADVSQFPSAEDSYHPQDLVNIFLDHLRWGNPKPNHLLSQAKNAVIEHLASRLLKLIQTNDPFVVPNLPSDASTPKTAEEFEARLKEEIKQGIDERLEGLNRFGYSRSTPFSDEIRDFLEVVFAHKSEAWRNYVLKVHGLEFPLINHPYQQWPENDESD